MNTIDHHKVVTLAVEGLPERSREFWSARCADLESTCMLPDEMAIPLLNGETGPWRHYFPRETPRHSFEKPGAAARDHFFDLRFYVDNVLAALGRGDRIEACRFLGVFSHCLGDFSEPAHYCEREITLLLPPPPDRVNCNPHRMIEDVPSTIARHTYAANVLGDTVDTVVMRLEGRLRQLYERAMASALPMLGALYQRDNDAAARLSNRVIAETVEVMGDVLHTVWCIEGGGWTAGERLRLASCRLDALEPAAYDVEFLYGCRPIRGAITLDQVGQAMPLQLTVAEGRGTTVRSVEGLCVVPHALPIRGTQYLASLDFDLPANGFTRFQARIGLLAGIQPQAPCRFVVEGDGGVLFEAGPVGAEDASRAIEVTVAGIRRLRLVVHTDGSTDKLSFPIWAWPVLEA